MPPDPSHAVLSRLPVLPDHFNFEGSIPAEVQDVVHLIKIRGSEVKRECIYHIHQKFVVLVPITTIFD